MSEKNDRMNEKRLKKCPFCGGENIIQTYTNFVPSLLCSGCGAKMIAPMDCFGKDYEKLLADRWNTRVPMEKIMKRLEEENQERVDMANMTMDIYVDGQVSGLERAIDIVKEEGGLND